MAILERENNRQLSLSGNYDLFTTKAYAYIEAEQLVHCFLVATGILTVAEVFAGQVPRMAILGAFRAVAGRILGWVGVGIAVYEFGSCLGYW